MDDFHIRAATPADIPTLIRHRRMMWLDMGRPESALEDLDDAAREYFTAALPSGRYRGFLAITPAGEIVGGGVLSSARGRAASTRRRPSGR
jgi:hypothetical protein